MKLLLTVVIAAALVKIAFFPTVKAEETDIPDPSMEFGQLTVSPEVGTISNQLSLEGTVESDPATPVKVTFEGEVSVIYIADGVQVAEGDAILLLRRQMPGEKVVTYDEEGNEIVSEGPPVWWTKTIYAPTAGTLKLNALEGQQFAIGDQIGLVQPPTYSAVATLTPDQMYRIQSVPETATITIKNGPAPFECTGLRIVTPEAPADPANPGGTTGTNIQARCAIPADQMVFVGLQVTMDIVAGEAADVLTLPASAVVGRYQTGIVFKPTDNPDEPEKVAVTLGITDGQRVQILDGITESDEVLEFVPGDTSEMQCNPMTGEGC